MSKEVEQLKEQNQKLIEENLKLKELYMTSQLQLIRIEKANFEKNKEKTKKIE
jgi:hypothetical protein